MHDQVMRALEVGYRVAVAAGFATHDAGLLLDSQFEVWMRRSWDEQAR